jgi:hypothetical protein
MTAIVRFPQQSSHSGWVVGDLIADMTRQTVRLISVRWTTSQRAFRLRYEGHFPLNDGKRSRCWSTAFRGLSLPKSKPTSPTSMIGRN